MASPALLYSLFSSSERLKKALLKRIYAPYRVAHRPSHSCKLQPSLSELRIHEKMVKKNMTPIICLLIIIMDIVAGILGIEAEKAQNKVKHVRMWIFECRDPSYQAFKLGLAAAALMGLAHVLANLLGGCICIRSREDMDKATANKQLAVASLIFSWIILAIGFSMLIIGAVANSKSRKYCGISHHRLLSIGGILCFIHGLFLVAYYVSAAATIKETKNQHETPA